MSGGMEAMLAVVNANQYASSLKRVREYSGLGDWKKGKLQSREISEIYMEGRGGEDDQRMAKEICANDETVQRGNNLC